MDSNEKIIEFEDLFKKEINKRKTKYRPLRKKNYQLAILMYILILFVFATVVSIIAYQIDSFKKQNVDQVLEIISYDVGGIAIYDKETYNLARTNNKNNVETIDLSDNYVIVINKKNIYAEDFLFTKNENDELVLNSDRFYYVFQIRGITKWNEDLDINVYYGETQNLIFNYHNGSIMVPFSDELTGFVSSFINFLIYLLLAPIIIYILKVDLVEDYKDFKVDKVQGINQVIVGYFILIVANLLSSNISLLLGNLFKIPPGESINQQIIVNALMSNGAILMIISAVILGPIVEELIFRKAIFGLFKKNGSAIVVSSLVFGAIHLLNESSLVESLVNGISYFIMGFVFGYIYIKNNRNIVVPIIVHILSNLISVLLILFYL